MPDTIAHPFESPTAGRFHTVRQRASANAMARETVRQSVKFRRQEVAAFLAAGLHFLTRGHSAGISADYLDDFAKGLSDAVSDAVGGMRRELDDAGCGDLDAANVDTAELDKMLGKEDRPLSRNFGGSL